MTELFTGISCFAVMISAVIAFIATKKNNEWAAKANKYQEDLLCIQAKASKYAELSNCLQEELIRIQAGERFLDWRDIEKNVSIIIKKMNEDNFVPNYVIASFERDAIVAFMICRELKERIPIFVGMLAIVNVNEEVHYDGFEAKILSNTRKKSGKTYLLVQEKLPIKSCDKILIVRDHITSGISINTLTDYFVEKYDLNPNNIKAACIACPAGVRHVPDYFCFHSDRIWFPWGKNL